MKAEKKAAEKEAKVKELVEQKEPNDQGSQNASALDEETLDPTVKKQPDFVFSLFFNY